MSAKFRDCLFDLDLESLPKSILFEIASDLKLECNKKTDSTTLKQLISATHEKWRTYVETKESLRSKILAGRTTISWYQVSNMPTQEVIEANIKASTGKNIGFRRTVNSDIDCTEPVLIHASTVSNNIFLLRFLVSDGLTAYFRGTETFTVHEYDIGTVFINIDESMIELRGTPKHKEKIIESLGKILTFNNSSEAIISSEPYDFFCGFKSGIKELADALNGRLCEAQSKPNINLDLPSEHKDYLKKFFQAIENYIKTQSSDELMSFLEDSSSKIEVAKLSLGALILSGINNLRMSVITESENDLSNEPLFSLLENEISVVFGFVAYPYIVSEGVESEISIKIGSVEKSVYFLSNRVTDAVIEDFKKRIIKKKEPVAA